MVLPETGCSTATFDLITEQCIPVVTSAGQLEWQPLRDVFARADSGNIAVSHSSPGTEIACYELLLAICHAAGCTPGTVRDWSSSVTTKRSLDPVVNWLLEDGKGRFDLFDPKRPFGQNVGLAGAVEDLGYSPVQLMLERAKDSSQFADHVHLHDLEPVEARDAFLALITQHCYGLGGRMMTEGVVKHLEHGLGYGQPFTYGSVARLGTRVRVLALGETLGDTLRLNLSIHPAYGTFNGTWDDRSRRSFRALRESRDMDGPADWHSTPGRSVLLHGVCGQGAVPAVDRVLLGMGETVTVESDSYADHDAVYVKDRPLKAAVGRALWRDAHAIYSASLSPRSGESLFGLLGDELTSPVRLLAVGLDADRSKVRGWVRDVFPFDPERKAELTEAAEVGVQLTQDAVTALNDGAAEAFRVIYPACPDKQRESLRARFDASEYVWARAGGPFHRLLDRVEGGGDPRSELWVYADVIRGITAEALGERLRSLPPNGRGWEARVRARARLQSGLRRRHFKEYVDPND